MFHPGNPMHLEPGRLAALVRDNLDAGALLVCHETLYGQTNREALCRGFFDAYAPQTRTYRTMTHLFGPQWYDEIPPPTNPGDTTMTRTIEITGASDDLIEINGDIGEEFTYGTRDPSPDLLAFSDGTILRVTYSQSGVWRITLIRPGTATLTIRQAPEGDDLNYTDTATLVGDITWVVQGVDFATAR